MFTLKNLARKELTNSLTEIEPRDAITTQPEVSKEI